MLKKKKKIILFFSLIVMIIIIFICSQKTIVAETESENFQTSQIVETINDDMFEEIENEEVIPTELEEIPIEENIESVEENKENEENIQPKEEKVVKYKGKEVTVPTVKKAPVNDVEDHKQNSSTAGTATATTVEEAKKVIENQEKEDKNYEQVSNSVGIDVSKWNGNINWADVKNAGIEFAMIRVGYRGSTQGTIMEDPYFQKNISGAIKNGVKVGIYFYSMAINEEEAIQEAAWVVSAIRKYSITYPVAYDLESWGQGRIADVSYSQLTNNAIAFLGYIKSSGYTPMMYASKYDFNNRWQKGRITGCKYWLAHYTKQTDYTGSYQMWQYSDKGTVAGISGYVDMNIAYFSYSKTEAPKHTCDFKLEKVLKEATCTEDGQVVYRCECGDSKIETVNATGHNFGEWTVTKVPTEDSEGERIRTCEKCHLEEKETIEKLPKDENNIVENISTTNNTVVNNETNNQITNNTVVNNETNNTVNNVPVNQITNNVVSNDNNDNATNNTTLSNENNNDSSNEINTSKDESTNVTQNSNVNVVENNLENTIVNNGIENNIVN